MKFAYYPGCTLSTTAKEFGQSMEAMCRVLGIELEEVPDWNCCGASCATTLNHALDLNLNARNLSLAAPLGLDLAVPCAACFARLKGAQHELSEDPELLDHVEGGEQLKQHGLPRVLNFLQVMDRAVDLDELKTRVVRPLTGLRPAAYYGCLLLRPPDTAESDDPERPEAMERILEALGCEPVTWYAKTDCCGAALAATRGDIVETLCTKIAERARKAGANCLATACPMCHLNMESRQRPDKHAPLPTFFVTELIGLALGLRPQEVGLGAHLVNPRPLLRALDLWGTAVA